MPDKPIFTITEIEKEIFDTLGHSWACEPGDENPLEGCVCNGGTYWKEIKPIVEKHMTSTLRRYIEGITDEIIGGDVVIVTNPPLMLRERLIAEEAVKSEKAEQRQRRDAILEGLKAEKESI